MESVIVPQKRDFAQVKGRVIEGIGMGKGSCVGRCSGRCGSCSCGSCRCSCTACGSCRCTPCKASIAMALVTRI